VSPVVPGLGQWVRSIVPIDSWVVTWLGKATRISKRRCSAVTQCDDMLPRRNDDRGINYLLATFVLPREAIPQEQLGKPISNRIFPRTHDYCSTHSSHLSPILRFSRQDPSTSEYSRPAPILSLAHRNPRLLLQPGTAYRRNWI